MAKPIWKLLYFDKKQGIEPALTKRVTELNLPFLEPFLISSSLLTSAQLPNIYFDIDEVTHKRYGIRQPVFYLVRPDNHIAVRTRDLRDVSVYLKKLYPATLDVAESIR